MSIAMQNEIDALKAKVKSLEAQLSHRATVAFDVAKEDWDEMKALIESLDEKVKGLLQSKSAKKQ